MSQLFTQTYINQITSWLVHSWSTFGAWTSHKQTWIHKTHHNVNLGEANTFCHIVFSMLSHKACIQMSFCPKIPKLKVFKFSKLGFPQLWNPIVFCVNFQLRWGLKKSCSLHWDLSHSMWHTTCTQINQTNSRLLVVRNQINNLTPNPSFGHNLCFKYINGSCTPYTFKNMKCDS
jgi:hypothetical protein